MSHSAVSAEDAYKTIMANNRSSYTKSLKAVDDAGYVAPFFENSFHIRRDDEIFTMGSCFARNIERFLVKKGFRVPMFEFDAPPEECNDAWAVGRSLFNKYNPYSMLNAINGAIGAVDLSSTVVEWGDGYLDLQLHTTKTVTHARAMSRVNEINDLFLQALKYSRIVVITLGLVESWYDREVGLYINQPPSLKLVKAYPGRFAFEVLSPEKVFNTTEQVIALIKSHGHAEQRVVLTVSPVPLGRTFRTQGALVANQYSKSVLRTAAEIVTQNNPHVDYFPSYESIILSKHSLAYMEDNVHVRPEAVAFNVNRMIEAYCGIA